MLRPARRPGYWIELRSVRRETVGCYLYLGLRLVEGYILVLLVQRRAVHLPPAPTLSAQVILSFLAGFVGLLFATPIVAAGLVLVRMIYVEGIFGDRESDPAPFA